MTERGAKRTGTPGLRKHLYFHAFLRLKFRVDSSALNLYYYATLS